VTGNRKARSLKSGSADRSADESAHEHNSSASRRLPIQAIWPPTWAVKGSGVGQFRALTQRPNDAIATKQHSQTPTNKRPDHKPEDNRDLCLETSISKRGPDICKLRDLESEITIIQFEQSAVKTFLLGSPDIDDLLTLIPFNMWRALINNARALHYEMEDMDSDDSLSRFYDTVDDGRQCPPSLRPTAVQRSIPHHPWLDLFPIPRMRDNLILAGGSLNEDELCIQLVGFSSANAGSGIAIWGEADDPLNWEVTEAFVRNWKWILEGCDIILESTNKWRVKRGEKRLSFR